MNRVVVVPVLIGDATEATLLSYLQWIAATPGAGQCRIAHYCANYLSLLGEYSTSAYPGLGDDVVISAPIRQSVEDIGFVTKYLDRSAQINGGVEFRDDKLQQYLATLTPPSSGDRKPLYLVVEDNTIDPEFTSLSAFNPGDTFAWDCDGVAKNGDFGGYHYYDFAIQAPYAVIPICGQTDLSGATTHELVEAMTDPVPFTGWVGSAGYDSDDGGELADYCEDDPNLHDYGDDTYFGQTVASFYSQVEKRCLGDPPTTGAPSTANR